ncbi:DUF3825 domain-containing protein [Candidatus Cryosericum septentrionale]|jgi:hypothetical protein|nr:DUF3825 domain-containing protein [Candidatus Cryosericum septentrionale]
MPCASGKADLALVVEEDAKTQAYLTRTVFSLDMAYLDAQPIAKPNRERLNP